MSVIECWYNASIYKHTYVGNTYKTGLIAMQQITSSTKNITVPMNPANTYDIRSFSGTHRKTTFRLHIKLEANNRNSGNAHREGNNWDIKNCWIMYCASCTCNIPDPGMECSHQSLAAGVRGQKAGDLLADIRVHNVTFVIHKVSRAMTGLWVVCSA